MKNYDEAVKILNTDPLPDNAEELFDTLIVQSEGIEKLMIEGLSEALFTERHKDKS